MGFIIRELLSSISHSLPPFQAGLLSESCLPKGRHRALQKLQEREGVKCDCEPVDILEAFSEDTIEINFSILKFPFLSQNRATAIAIADRVKCWNLSLSTFYSNVLFQSYVECFSVDIHSSSARHAPVSPRSAQLPHHTSDEAIRPGIGKEFGSLFKPNYTLQ